NNTFDLRQQQISDGQQNMEEIWNPLRRPALHMLVDPPFMTMRKIHHRIMKNLKVTQILRPGNLEPFVARSGGIACGCSSPKDSRWEINRDVAVGEKLFQPFLVVTTTQHRQHIHETLRAFARFPNLSLATHIPSGDDVLKVCDKHRVALRRPAPG